MGQVINTNSLSLLTQNNLNKSQASMNTAIQRLSSGMRINSAKDDAAGQAIANRFTANIKGLTQASRNANDGISLAQTTEGALGEVNTNLQRIRELAVQSTNGSNSDADRASIQSEITQRLEEIDRTSKQTDFNGVKVLSSTAGKLNVQIGANDGQTIAIDLEEISAKTLGLDGFSVSTKAVKFADTISLKSEAAPAATNVTATTGDNGANKAFGTTFAAGFANDGAALTYLTTGDTTANATGDTTTANTAAIANAVYSVKIDGGSYFVSRDTAAGNQINLLKQDGLGGYAKVTLGGKDVQVAAFSGKLTAFTKETGDVATKVDLTGGVDGAKTGKALAYNDTNLVLNVGGKNLNVHQVVKDGVAVAGQFAVKTDDGKVLAVAVGTGVNAGNIEIAKDASGNNVEYVLDKNGDAKAALNVSGKTYQTTLPAYGAAATQGAEFAAGDLQATGTANPLAKLDAALSKVDVLRGSLGAVQNRFDSVISNLGTTITNLSSSRSRIEDADYATEVSNMTRAQILQQAGTSVLAKANQSTQGVMSLLQ